MSCAAEYCRYLDIVVILGFALLYGAGVYVCHRWQRARYEQMLDQSFNPGKYSRRRTPGGRP